MLSYRIDFAARVFPGTSKSRLEGKITVVAEKNIGEGDRAELILKADHTAEMFKRECGIEYMPVGISHEDDVF